MKTIRNYICLFLLLSGYGCNDFLEETSLTLVYPSDLNDLEQLFVGEAYRTEAINNTYDYYHLLCDNYEQNTDPFALQYFKLQDRLINVYLWNPLMFSEELNDAMSGVERVWSEPYKRILGCNLVLDHADALEGTDRDREALRGEALTLRAWCYLQLVNAFGVAYNQGNPATEPGVPLKLESGVRDEYFSRASVQDVYDRIEKDLQEGNRLLRSYPARKNNIGRMNHLAAKAILSRMYLYQEKWDQAINWADSVLMEKDELLDLNTLNNVSSASAPDSIYATEALWMRSYRYPSFENIAVVIVISDELLQAYGVSDRTQISTNPDGVSDLRSLKMLTMQSGRLNYPMLCSDSYFRESIRTAELYLNRAEAYARKYIQENNPVYKDEALRNLNIIRQHRFRKENYRDMDSDVDGGTLLEECVNERWRELGGEINHRWCDVRRYGKTLRHQYDDLSAEQDMSRFTLPIPDKVSDANPSL